MSGKKDIIILLNCFNPDTSQVKDMGYTADDIIKNNLWRNLYVN